MTRHSPQGIMWRVNEDLDHLQQAQRCPWCHGPTVVHTQDPQVISWTCPNPSCTWPALTLTWAAYHHIMRQP